MLVDTAYEFISLPDSVYNAYMGAFPDTFDCDDLRTLPLLYIYIYTVGTKYSYYLLTPEEIMDIETCTPNVRSSGNEFIGVLGKQFLRIYYSHFKPSTD